MWKNRLSAAGIYPEVDLINGSLKIFKHGYDKIDDGFR